MYLRIDVYLIPFTFPWSGGWGYAPRYESLAQLLKDEVPGVNVTGAVANRGDFEITVNGQLIFSKQAKGCFPKSEAVSPSSA